MSKQPLQLHDDQRPYIQVYVDSLESDLMDTHYQKIIFIYLKKYANSKQQCFPSMKRLSEDTGIGLTKVKQTIKELVEKGILTKQTRTRSNGGKTSNLYTVHDTKWIWEKKEPEPENQTVNEEKQIDQLSSTELIKLLQARGYTITKKEELLPETKKEPASEIGQISETSSYQKNIHETNNTTNKNFCQVSEKYSMRDIYILYEYRVLIRDYKTYREDIDFIFQLLYDVLNTTKETMTIGGNRKKSMVVISQFMKLTKDDLIYAIERFHSVSTPIKNTRAYMLTLLYNTPLQRNLELINQMNQS